jgi:hypothetical protein
MDLYAKMRQTAGVNEVNWSKVTVAAFELVENCGAPDV